MSQAAIERDVRRARAPVGAILLVLLLLALTGVLAWRGYDFYLLSLDSRVDHDDFRVLGPGEVVGHGYGVVGTGLIFTNLLYLVRRKLARWPLGSMRFWLDLHVVTGLVGSLLILFHSAFQLRTPIATVTAVSLLVVVLTGVVGRYLYALAPQTDQAALAGAIDGVDGIVPGLGVTARKLLAALPITDVGGHAGFLRTLLTLPTWWRESRARRVGVRALAERVPADLPPEERALLGPALDRLASLAAGEPRTMAAATLLRTWRSLHRLLALLMLLSVTVHIVVAWFYGYRWIFSE